MEASLTQRKTVPQNSRSWDWPPTCMTESDKSRQHMCREVACESDKRHRDKSFSQRSQRNSGIKYHTVVLDHAVGGSQENRETRGSRATQWQSIPESFLEVSRAQVQRLRRSRVLHSSAGVTRQAKSMELEEQTRREVAHEAARK